MPNLFQQSSLTFGSAKQFIAEQAGKQQTTEMLNRAGRSLQSAIQDWNKFNWKWLLTTATITASASGAPFALPYDLKDIYDVYSTGTNPQWIPAISRRHATRSNVRGLATAPYAYDIFSKGGSGRLALQGSSATSLSLEYYRRMAVPCLVTGVGTQTELARGWLAATEGTWGGTQLGSPVILSTGFAKTTADQPILVTAVKQEHGVVTDSNSAVSLVLGALATARNSSLQFSNATAVASASATSITATIGGDSVFLDIPETYEWGILARGVVHFLAGVGGPADKMQEWKEQSAVKLEEALRDDREAEDHDVCFAPVPTYWSYNPNRIWE